jgi:hypothetical protein
MENDILKIWNNYLQRHPEDSSSLRELMFTVGVSKIMEILKNANGRKIEIKSTLDVRNYVSWRYVNDR